VNKLFCNCEGVSLTGTVNISAWSKPQSAWGNHQPEMHQRRCMNGPGLLLSRFLQTPYSRSHLATRSSSSQKLRDLRTSFGSHLVAVSTPAPKRETAFHLPSDWLFWYDYSDAFYSLKILRNASVCNIFVSGIQPLSPQTIVFFCSISGNVCAVVKRQRCGDRKQRLKQ